MVEEMEQNEQQTPVEEATATSENKTERQEEVTADTPPTDEMTELKNELAAQKDKYVRLFAEFDNFKRRSAKERLELIKVAGQEIVRELLPVLDDIQRAEKAYVQDQNAENFASGARLILEKLQKSLQSKGLKPLESIGKEFNIEFHEAIAEVPAASEEQKGKIIDEVESGYMLNDTIIRYAKVVVGK